MRAVQFGVYFFAFMLAETIVNDQAARFFAPQMVNVVYAGGIACTGLGCLSYALVQKRWNTPAAAEMPTARPMVSRPAKAILRA